MRPILDSVPSATLPQITISVSASTAQPAPRKKVSPQTPQQPYTSRQPANISQKAPASPPINADTQHILLNHHPTAPSSPHAASHSKHAKTYPQPYTASHTSKTSPASATSPPGVSSAAASHPAPHNQRACACASSAIDAGLTSRRGGMRGGAGALFGPRRRAG